MHDKLWYQDISLGELDLYLATVTFTEAFFYVDGALLFRKFRILYAISLPCAIIACIYSIERRYLSSGIDDR